MREELRQVLDLNNSGSDKKLGKAKEKRENAKKTFVVEREGEDPRVTAEYGKKEKNYEAPPSKQMQYPLLKPVAFTNALEDDYLSLAVWSLK